MYLSVTVKGGSLLLHQHLELAQPHHLVLLLLIGPDPETRQLTCQVTVWQHADLPGSLRVRTLDTDVEERQVSRQLTLLVTVLQDHTATLSLHLGSLGQEI